MFSASDLAYRRRSSYRQDIVLRNLLHGKGHRRKGRSRPAAHRPGPPRRWDRVGGAKPRRPVVSDISKNGSRPSGGSGGRERGGGGRQRASSPRMDDGGARLLLGGDRRDRHDGRFRLMLDASRSLAERLHLELHQLLCPRPELALDGGAELDRQVAQPSPRDRQILGELLPVGPQRLLTDAERLDLVERGLQRNDLLVEVGEQRRVGFDGGHEHLGIQVEICVRRLCWRHNTSPFLYLGRLNWQQRLTYGFRFTLYGSE